VECIARFASMAIWACLLASVGLDSLLDVLRYPFLRFGIGFSWFMFGSRYGMEIMSDMAGEPAIGKTSLTACLLLPDPLIDD
jgi:hypothetical protein